MCSFFRRRRMSTRELLFLIIKKLTQMAETFESLSAKVDTQNGILDKIQTDITNIKNGLPTSGGMTQAQVDELGAKLDASISKAQGIDDQTADA